MGLPRATSLFCNQQCFTVRTCVCTHAAHAHAGGMEAAQKDPQTDHRHVAVCHQSRQGMTARRVHAPRSTNTITSQGRSDAMPTFSWTGSLRPDLVGPRRSVPASIPKPDWAVGGIPREEMDSPQQALGGCCDRLSLPLSSVHLPTIIPTIIHYDSASALCQGHCRHPARLHAGTSRARCSTRGHCAWSHHRRGGRGGAQGNHCWGSLPIPSQLLPLSKELLHLCQRGASCAVGYRCTRCLCMCMRMEST